MLDTKSIFSEFSPELICIHLPWKFPQHRYTVYLACNFEIYRVVQKSLGANVLLLNVVCQVTFALSYIQEFEISFHFCIHHKLRYIFGNVEIRIQQVYFVFEVHYLLFHILLPSANFFFSAIPVHPRSYYCLPKVTKKLVTLTLDLALTLH